MQHTMAYKRADGTVEPGLEARRGDQVPADGAQVLREGTDMTATADAPAEVGTIPSMTVTLKILRFDPDGLDGREPGTEYWEEFQVEAHATDRVLDALHKIKWDQDGSLAFRRSCAHGVCGSDAMRINARNRLACKTLLKDLNPARPITVEPLKGLPVEKDLIVDMEPFFASYREIMPFLMTSGPTPERERLQSPEDRAKFDDTTKCILCAACTTSLPRVLDRRPVLRAPGHRGCPPFHLRLARRGRVGPSRDPQRQGGRVEVPHGLQLHRGLPARHRGDQGHLRGQEGVDHRRDLGLRPRLAS
ncbi:hypothetical protein GCM10025876_10650 [Demequina litorisediminis]|uniref:Succinate dehydogenase/fumarate reductase N-terminal domain-containing protein n=1 Tax=Demequina litorisediminis TaxID=1849022 RepID=A0ABQ6IC61_9MICO|nr:hypothetical protein GCM10025876_10650 [Demequina litorisediminis]